VSFRGVRFPATVVIVLVVLVVVACNGSGPKEVEVRLKEWEVATSPVEVKSGRITFDVRNDGTRAHELIVVKEDLPPGELPLAAAGVDKGRLNVRAVMDPLAPGDSQQLATTLSPGKYVLLCNVIDGAAPTASASHYRNGMATSLLVLP
jgi:hypothetical protein